MDVLNLLFGLVTIGSGIFSIIIYYQSKTKELVETTKLECLKKEMDKVAGLINGVGLQNNLAINISEREETTKKEIKHLLINQQYTIEQIINFLKDQREYFTNWKYGEPLKYLHVNHTQRDAEIISVNDKK